MDNRNKTYSILGLDSHISRDTSIKTSPNPCPDMNNATLNVGIMLSTMRILYLNALDIISLDA